MFKCESIRLCRYLYSLGFDKISKFENGKEYWLFKRSPLLQKALDFFFIMRKETGVNDSNGKKNCNRKNMESNV